MVFIIGSLRQQIGWARCDSQRNTKKSMEWWESCIDGNRWNKPLPPFCRFLCISLTVTLCSTN